MIIPSVERYQNWLDENDNSSPLYISEELRTQNFMKYAETMYSDSDKEEWESYKTKLRIINDGLITRKQFNEIPPHVEYSFTQKGKDLLPIFYAMLNWGFEYANK